MSPTRRAAWLEQLASLLEAGIPIASALLEAGGPPLAIRRKLAKRIEDGESIQSILEDEPPWLKPRDRYMLSVAASQGRLPQACLRLAKLNIHTAKSQGRALVMLIYPLLVLHAAILVLPLGNQVMAAVDGQINWMQAIIQSAIGLGALWATLTLLFLGIRGEWPVFETLARIIPGFRGWRQSAALNQAAETLSLLVETGLDIGHAWEAVSLLTPSPALRKASEQVVQHIENGHRPSELLPALKVFPADFVAFYTTGERTGTLDEKLAQVAHSYDDKARARLTTALVIYPSILMLLIAAAVVASIFKMYAGYLQQITDMME